VIGATFDSGALIALERRDLSMLIKLRVLHQAGVPITIPANAVVEWWRKGHGQSAILDLGTVEPLKESIAKAAGEALAKVRGATAVDATVMASAAQRGDRVFTSDPTDMQRLQGHFRAVAGIIPV
jgi:predicted nucleic acid-binding protein